MFWNSILAGLQLLLHWEFWVSFVLYMTLFVAFNWVLFLVSGKDQQDQRGCVVQALFGPMYEGITIGIFIVFLIPSVFLDGGLPPLPTLGASLVLIVPAAFVSVLCLFILAVIPIIGHFMQAMPAAYKSIQGVVVFRIIYAVVPSSAESVAYPSIFSLLAFLAIGVALGSVMTTLLAWKAISHPDEEPSDRFALFMAHVGFPAAGSLMGLFPVIMYMSYAGISAGT